MICPKRVVFLTVDSAKEMLGTFSPQAEPYKHEMPEETTPSGIFARGSYTARTRVSQIFPLASFELVTALFRISLSHYFIR